MGTQQHTWAYMGIRCTLQVHTWVYYGDTQAYMGIQGYTMYAFVLIVV